MPASGWPRLRRDRSQQGHGLLGPDKTFLGQTYDEDEPHIVCPWHGWEYKLKTGECAPYPNLRLRSYSVVQREGGIYVVI